MDNKTCVLIVGGGPTGLTMGIELCRRSIPFRLIEKREEPVETSNALTVQPRTLEIWEDEGVLDDALSRGIEIHAMNLYANEKRLARISFDGLDSPFNYQLALAQSESERILAQRLARLGGSVERSKSLVSLSQTDTKTTATVQLANGTEESIVSDWLVGCDGARSTVRNQLHVPFEGSDLPEHFVMADLNLRWHLPRKESHVFFSKRGSFGVISLKEFSRIIFDVTGDSELGDIKTPRLEHFQRLMRERSIIPAELGEPHWMSGLWTHQRISSAYRVGRVFLAGDAAHVHSPVGGQGMNTGIQDAYNLAWKLASVVAGEAQPELLDSYEKERRPIAADVLKRTTFMTRLVAINNPVGRLVRNFTLQILLNRDKVRQRLSAQTANLSIHYRRSPAVSEQIAGKHAAPLLRAGDRIPYSAFLRGVHHKLLLFTGPMPATQDYDHLRTIAQQTEEKYGELIKSYLIHPDSHIPNEQNQTIATISDDDNVWHAKYKIRVPSLFLIRPDDHISFAAAPAAFHPLDSYIQLMYQTARRKVSQ